MTKYLRAGTFATALFAVSTLAVADVGLETDTVGYSVSEGSFSQVTGFNIDFTADGVDYAASVAPSVGTGFGVLQTTATTTPTALTYTFAAPTDNADVLLLRLASIDDGFEGAVPDDLITLTAYDQFNDVSFTQSFTTSSFLASAPGAPYPDSGWLGFTLGSGTSSFTITLANADNGDYSPILFVDYFDSPTVVPEAGSVAMTLAGLAVVGALAARRRNKQQA